MARSNVKEGEKTGKEKSKETDWTFTTAQVRTGRGERTDVNKGCTRVN